MNRNKSSFHRDPSGDLLQELIDAHPSLEAPRSQYAKHGTTSKGAFNNKNNNNNTTSSLSSNHSVVSSSNHTNNRNTTTSSSSHNNNSRNNRNDTNPSGTTNSNNNKYSSYQDGTSSSTTATTASSASTAPAAATAVRDFYVDAACNEREDYFGHMQSHTKSIVPIVDANEDGFSADRSGAARSGSHPNNSNTVKAERDAVTSSSSLSPAFNYNNNNNNSSNNSNNNNNAAADGNNSQELNAVVDKDKRKELKEEGEKEEKEIMEDDNSFEINQVAVSKVNSTGSNHYSSFFNPYTRSHNTNTNNNNTTTNNSDMIRSKATTTPSFTTQKINSAAAAATSMANTIHTSEETSEVSLSTNTTPLLTRSDPTLVRNDSRASTTPLLSSNAMTAAANTITTTTTVIDPLQRPVTRVYTNSESPFASRLRSNRSSYNTLNPPSSARHGSKQSSINSFDGSAATNPYTVAGEEDSGPDSLDHNNSNNNNNNENKSHTTSPHLTAAAWAAPPALRTPPPPPNTIITSTTTNTNNDSKVTTTKVNVTTATDVTGEGLSSNNNNDSSNSIHNNNNNNSTNSDSASQLVDRRRKKRPPPLFSSPLMKAAPNPIVLEGNNNNNTNTSRSGSNTTAGPPVLSEGDPLGRLPPPAMTLGALGGSGTASTLGGTPNSDISSSHFGDQKTPRPTFAGRDGFSGRRRQRCPPLLPAASGTPTALKPASSFSNNNNNSSSQFGSNPNPYGFFSPPYSGINNNNNNNNNNSNMNHLMGSIGTANNDTLDSKTNTMNNRNRLKGDLVRLSHNRETLVASIFRVSKEGCSTVRNVLLLNPKRIDENDGFSPNSRFSAVSPSSGAIMASPRLGMGSPRRTPTSNNGPSSEWADCYEENGLRESLLPPAQQQRNFNSSFTLQSSVMNTPYSPINYSMDNPFPTVYQSQSQRPGSGSAYDHGQPGGGRTSIVEGRPQSNFINNNNNNNGYVILSPSAGTNSSGNRLLRAARDANASLSAFTHNDFYNNSLLHAGTRVNPSGSISVTGSAFSPISSEVHMPGSLLPYSELPNTTKLLNAGSESPRVLPSNAVRYEDLLIKTSIGEGASAAVFVAIHKATGRRLAVKRVDLSPLCLNTNHSSKLYSAANAKVKQLQHIVVRELQVLHLTYRSPFMVKVYNAFYIAESQALDIVMEFMHYGSFDQLARYLQKHARTLKDKVQEERRMLNDDEGMESSLGEEDNSFGDMQREIEELDSFNMYTPPHGFLSPKDYGASMLHTPLSNMVTENFPFVDFTASEANNARPLTPLEFISVKSNASSEGSYDEGTVVEEVFGVAERVVAVVGEQLLRGVRDMHHRNYIHRDIKPGNVLVNEHGVVKLSDFGLSQRCDASGVGIANPQLLVQPPPDTRMNTPMASPRLVSLQNSDPQVAEGVGPRRFSNSNFRLDRSDEDQEQEMDVLTGSHTSVSDNDGEDGDGDSSEEEDLCSGTDKYMSPERQRGEPHGKPSDVWAVGVTLAEFAVGKYPYNIQQCNDVFERVKILEEPISFASFNEHRFVPLSAAFQDFIALATLPKPEDRPTARELLEHPFFRQWKSPFNLKEYLSERVPVPSNAFKEEFLRERRIAQKRSPRSSEVSSSLGANQHNSTNNSTNHTMTDADPITASPVRPGGEEEMASQPLSASPRDQLAPISLGPSSSQPRTSHESSALLLPMSNNTLTFESVPTSPESRQRDRAPPNDSHARELSAEIGEIDEDDDDDGAMYEEHDSHSPKAIVRCLDTSDGNNHSSNNLTAAFTADAYGDMRKSNISNNVSDASLNRNITNNNSGSNKN